MTPSSQKKRKKTAKGPKKKMPLSENAKQLESGNGTNHKFTTPLIEDNSFTNAMHQSTGGHASSGGGYGAVEEDSELAIDLTADIQHLGGKKSE